MKQNRWMYAKLVLIVLMLGLLSGCEERTADEINPTEGSTSVTGKPIEPELTDTPEKTELITPTPEAKVQHAMLENGKLVFRYEEDREVLEQLQAEGSDDEARYAVMSGMDIVKAGQVEFLEEQKEADIIYVGTVFVPKDINCDELLEIVNTLSYMAYQKYQKEYPETNTEFVMFMGESETDLINLQYSDYDHFEYKKMTRVTAWKDETFVEISYQADFAVVIDICFQ